MLMPIKEFKRLAISVPFVEKGRSLDGWDCYGLVYVAYKLVLGIDVPIFKDGYGGTDVRHFREIVELVKQGKPLWTKVPTREPLDGVLFLMTNRHGRAEVHMGLILSKKTFMHARENIGTQLDDFDGLEWPESKVEGYYHYGNAPYPV